VAQERRARERCHVEAVRAGEKLRQARAHGAQLSEKLRAAEAAELRRPHAGSGGRCSQSVGRLGRPAAAVTHPRQGALSARRSASQSDIGRASHGSDLEQPFASAAEGSAENPWAPNREPRSLEAMLPSSPQRPTAPPQHQHPQHHHQQELWAASGSSGYAARVVHDFDDFVAHAEERLSMLGDVDRTAGRDEDGLQERAQGDHWDWIPSETVRARSRSPPAGSARSCEDLPRPLAPAQASLSSATERSLHEHCDWDAAMPRMHGAGLFGSSSPGTSWPIDKDLSLSAMLAAEPLVLQTAGDAAGPSGFREEPP